MKRGTFRLNRYHMGALYMAAGCMHFITPGFYLRLIPAWLPLPQFLVSFSGVVEILLGILLMPRATKRYSAWLIIAMLTVFFLVIHIPMAITFYERHDPYLWAALLRLPLQFLLIWWAWKVARPKQGNGPATPGPQ